MGKPLAWDVTVPDTYADAHASNTAMETGVASSLAATNKTNKYSQLSATHIFTPVASDTAGNWHHQAVELVLELGRRATIITGDSRETTYLFQQLSVALQKGNTVSFQNTAGHPFETSYLLLLNFNISAYGIVFAGEKN